MKTIILERSENVGTFDKFPLSSKNIFNFSEFRILKNNSIWVIYDPRVFDS